MFAKLSMATAVVGLTFAVPAFAGTGPGSQFDDVTYPDAPRASATIAGRVSGPEPAGFDDAAWFPGPAPADRDTGIAVAYQGGPEPAGFDDVSWPPAATPQEPAQTGTAVARGPGSAAPRG